MSRLDGCKLLTTRPPIRISPEVIDSSPAIVFRSVDLPQPEGPTRTRKPPFSSDISIPLRISRAPYFFRRERISSVDIRFILSQRLPSSRERSSVRRERRRQGWE